MTHVSEHWRREPMPRAALEKLNTGHCPDCRAFSSLRPGPKGGAAQNYACEQCGAEFNIGRFRGEVMMAHRNSPLGTPNLERLRRIFRIELPAARP